MLRRDRQALGARHLVDFTVQIFEMKLGYEMFIIKANCGIVLSRITDIVLVKHFI